MRGVRDGSDELHCSSLRSRKSDGFNLENGSSVNRKERIDLKETHFRSLVSLRCSHPWSEPGKRTKALQVYFSAFPAFFAVNSVLVFRLRHCK